MRIHSSTDTLAIAAAAKALLAGNPVVIPTDTVYGVAAHPGVPGATQRLYEAKGRDANKPIALLVTGLQAVENFGAVLTPSEKLLTDKYWPGPLTLVLKIRAGNSATSRAATYEGFRMPDSQIALSILQEAGGALRVTSANMSGEPDAVTAKQALDSLNGKVALVIDGGPVEGGVASTVVKMVNGRPQILREGAVTREDVRLCLLGQQ